MIEEMGCPGGLSYGSPTRKRGDEDVRRMTDQGPCMLGKDAGDGKDSLLSLTTPPTQEEQPLRMCHGLSSVPPKLTGRSPNSLHDSICR